MIIKITYGFVILSCLLLVAGLWLPATAWLRFIEVTIHPDADQLRKISDLLFAGSKTLLYRLVSILPFTIALLLWWKRNIFQRNIEEGANGFKCYLHQLWIVQSRLLREPKLIFLFLFAVILLYKYAFLFPFTVDEAFSWVHLVNKGPVVSALYYPAPNNHIFYTIVCSIVNYLPFDPVWVMRIPTVIAFILCIYMVYLVFARLINSNAGIVGGILFIVHPSMIYYALHGRGYMFLVLFVLLSIWFLYSTLINKVKYAQAGFIVSAVLGFYTVPVFLYYFILLAFTAVMYVCWHKEWKSLRFIVTLFATVAILTVLLYSPVIMLNGLDALIDNGWVQAQEFTLEQFFMYGMEVVQSVTAFSGLALALIVIFGISAVASFYYEKKSFRWLVWTLILWIPLLALILNIQKLMPFERIWVPLSLLWIAVLVWLDNWVTEYCKMKWMGIFFTVVSVFVMVFSLKSNFDKEDLYYTHLHGFVEMIDPKEVSTVYSADDTYLVMLQVKFAQAGKEAEFTTVNDLHGKNADLRIVPLSVATHEVVSPNEEAFYANTEVVAYRRKGLKILR